MLAEGWYSLQEYTVDYHRRDGTLQQLRRQVCHCGDRAVVLLYCPTRASVILTRQFRLPIFLRGHFDGMLIEAAGGLIDDDESAAEAIQREAEEETGLRITGVEEVFQAYMSPGFITERMHFFVAEFNPEIRSSGGGGSVLEGEDIEVLELPFNEALAMIQRREIIDGKTIMLLHYAQLIKLVHL